MPQLYRATPKVTDPDGDVVQLELSSSPGGMLMNDATREIVWAPTVSQIGLNSVTITASDANGASGVPEL